MLEADLVFLEKYESIAKEAELLKLLGDSLTYEGKERLGTNLAFLNEF